MFGHLKAACVTFRYGPTLKAKQMYECKGCKENYKYGLDSEICRLEVWSDSWQGSLACGGSGDMLYSYSVIAKDQ